MKINPAIYSSIGGDIQTILEYIIRNIGYNYIEELIKNHINLIELREILDAIYNDDLLEEINDKIELILNNKSIDELIEIEEYNIEKSVNMSILYIGILLKNYLEIMKFYQFNGFPKFKQTNFIFNEELNKYIYMSEIESNNIKNIKRLRASLYSTKIILFSIKRFIPSEFVINFNLLNKLNHYTIILIERSIRLLDYLIDKGVE